MIDFWFYATLFFVCMLIMACLTVRRLEKEVFKLKKRNIALIDLADVADSEKVLMRNILSSISEMANRRYGI